MQIYSEGLSIFLTIREKEGPYENKEQKRKKKVIQKSFHYLKMPAIRNSIWNNFVVFQEAPFNNYSSPPGKA